MSGEGEDNFANEAATVMFERLRRDAIEDRKKAALTNKDKSQPALPHKLSVIHEDSRENVAEHKSKDFPQPEAFIQGERQDPAVAFPDPDSGEDEKSLPPPDAKGVPNRQQTISPPEINPDLVTDKDEKTGPESSTLVGNLVYYYADMLEAAGRPDTDWTKELDSIVSRYSFLPRDSSFTALVCAVRSSQSLTAADCASSPKTNSAKLADEEDEKRERSRMMKESQHKLAVAVHAFCEAARDNLIRLLHLRGRGEIPTPELILAARTFSEEVSQLALPLARYCVRCGKSRKRLGVYRYLTFACKRRELEDSFMQTFYTPFDEKGTRKLHYEEFSSCIDLIAAKLKNNEMMPEMFELMGVQSESILGKLAASSGTTTDAEFSVDVYKKAFLQLRTFRYKDEAKDYVAFRRFLPYLYVFFLAFETKALQIRKKLYWDYRQWVVAAFREFALRDAHEQAAKGSTAALPVFRNSFDYGEVLGALTLLQAQHPATLGSREFRIITKRVQELLNVDPITLASKVSVPLTSSRTSPSPLLVWQNNTMHPDFNLERYLSFSLATLSMFQSLTSHDRGSKISLLREERLLMYNETHTVDKRQGLASYLRRAAGSGERQALPTQKFAARLVDWLSPIYPGFGIVDSLLVVDHFLTSFPGDKQSTISPSQQDQILGRIDSLLDSVAYERFFDFYLGVTAQIRMDPAEEVMSAADQCVIVPRNQVLVKNPTVGEPEEDLSYRKMLKEGERKRTVSKSVNASPKCRMKKMNTRAMVEDAIRVLENTEEKQKVSPKRGLQFDPQPTVFEGLIIKPKKKRQPELKYVDMAGVRFCRVEQTSVSKSGEGGSRGCKIV